MDMVFQEELLEMWLIVYIDNIIIFTDTWTDHLQNLPVVLRKIAGINMKILLLKCLFGFSQLKALGHFVIGISLGIDQHWVAATARKTCSTAAS
jgi:hypothetical protein